MVNHVKSDALKTQIIRKRKDNLMAQAVAYYLEKKSKITEGKPPSLRHICQTFSIDYYSRKHIQINLDHNTLRRLVRGGVTRSESNAKKSWLKYEEQEVILEYVIEMARRGFPLSPRRLREHAEIILRGRIGDKFPEDGLGKCWATRFITKHHERVGMYWSSPLDSSRARGVNPITNAEYFEVLGKVRKEYNILDELIYGADETGIQTGIGTTEHVIGPAGSKILHQQRNGNRENITILPTICGDGTSVPPTVIYKDEAFQTKWLQENPLDARYGPNNCLT